MTQPELLDREADDIFKRTGRYIPPYRMAFLMRIAQKIVEVILKSDMCATYEEYMIILDIVRNAIQSATGK